MELPKGQNPHRLELQGLRAVAIAAVTLYHFFPEICPNGFVGVDIFFVLSGYLISSILARQITDNGGLSLGILGSFYYRRLKRILPLHLLYCFAASVLIMLFSDPFRIPLDREAAMFAIPFITNIRSMSELINYFTAIKSDSLFTHTWSLSVEVQFYLIAPIIYALLPKRSRILSVLTISFVGYLFAYPIIAFNSMPHRLWQFLAGAVHIFETEKRESAQKETQKVSLLGEIASELDDANNDTERPSVISRYMAFLLVAAFMPMQLWPTTARVIVTIATSAIIHCDCGQLTNLLRHPSFVFVGDISYALYLVHWPIVIYFVDTDEFALYPSRQVGIPLSIAITILVHEVFERRYRLWTKAQIGGSCLLFLILTAVTLSVAQPVNERLYPVTPDITEAVEKNMKFFEDPQANLMIPECTYYGFRGTTNSTSFMAPHGACDMPAGNGSLRFAVIGNSYAPDHAKMIWQSFKPFFSEFKLFSEGGCEVLAQTPPSGCQMWFNYTDVLDDFKPDVTFIVQRYNRPRDWPLPTKANEPDFIYDEMFEHYRWLQRKSSFFYIVEPMPSTVFLEMRKLIGMIRRHTSPHVVNRRVMQPRLDATNALPRARRLGRECGNCVVYDVVRFLENWAGEVELYEGDTRLALMEPYAHLSPRGRERILPAYEELARNETNRLLELEKKLYSELGNQTVML